MTDTPVAVSGPTPSGNAGDSKATAGLEKAFSAAFEKVDTSTATFADEAPASPKTEATPVDDTAPEDAAPATPETGKTTAEKGKAKPKTPAEAAPKAQDQPASAMSPPAHWDAAKREAFGKLPPEAQKVVNDLARDLEAGFTRKSMEVADKVKFGESVRSLVTPAHRQQLQSAGMTEVDGFRRLLEYQDAFTRDPTGYVRWVAQQARLDPRQIFPQLAGGDGRAPAAQQQPQPPADPQFLRLHETIQNLSQEVNGFKRQQVDAQYRNAERSIANFRSATDESGQPKHPHFDKVEKQMDWILRSNPEILAIEDFEQRLKTAYDLAVYADPEIKTQLIDSEAERRLAEKARLADLNKAKRAQAPIKSAPVTAPDIKPKGLAAAAREAMRISSVS